MQALQVKASHTMQVNDTASSAGKKHRTRCRLTGKSY